MKTNLKFWMIAVFAILITACSPEDGKDGMDGAQGPAGQDGNANVSSYTFNVNRGDWGDNLHYGENNIFRRFDVTPNLTGGQNLRTIIDEGGAVLIYANTGEISATTLLPFSFSYMGIGAKLNVDFSRSILLISKTTNGWDNVIIALNEIPAQIAYTIVTIPKEAATKMSNKNIDLTDYNSVADLYNLEH